MGNIYNISDIIAGNEYMEYPTEWENIFIIPSDGRIDQLNDIATGDIKGYDDNQLNKFSSMLFDDLIADVSDEYDLIVIDTPPSKTHASQGAIAASSDCLVVANPDDTHTIDTTMNTSPRQTNKHTDTHPDKHIKHTYTRASPHIQTQRD